MIVEIGQQFRSGNLYLLQLYLQLRSLGFWYFNFNIDNVRLWGDLD